MSKVKFFSLIMDKMIIFPKQDLIVEIPETFYNKFNELKANDNNFEIVITSKQVNSKKTLFSLNDIYPVGIICHVNLLYAQNNKMYMKVIASNDIISIEQLDVTDQIYTVEGIRKNTVNNTEEIDVNLIKSKFGIINKLINQYDKIIQLDFYLKLNDLSKGLSGYNDESLSYIISLFPFDIEEKIEILKQENILNRLLKVEEIISYNVTKLETEKEVQSKSLKKMQKSQREYVLREQLNEIKKELGEDNKVDEFELKLKKAKLPLDVRKIAEEEYQRMTQLNPASQDYHVIKNYLDWIINLPFGKFTKDNLDIFNAQEILDKDHYGLNQVKKRILEFLSISKLKGSFRGQILCLAGPPGVGKTSLAQSIAKAIGRKYIRISLGGVHDEAEIRGHRRTYVGAMPGKIVQSLKKVQTSNPVILLDEIDKLGKSNHGDPAAAMLEVLDPEQNSSFNDHFMNLNMDLSNVFFIATANDLSEIPAPLRDRMEIIQLGSYTHTEKHHIVKNHLVTKQLKEFVLDDKKITLTDKAISKIINDYTREAGVRDLQRKVGQIFRFLAQEIVENKEINTLVDENKVKEILGNELVRHESALDYGEVGVVSGLAWTSVGGEMLFIESNYMPGAGRLILTGSLGNVMKESANIALSYIKANAKNLDIQFDFDKNDIHLHFPSGATPKDGPSAGIAICTCLVSLLKDKQIDNELAMTGEISLRGKVLAVGGIKEKVIAAHRAGIKTVILPIENKSNEGEIPDEVKQDLNIIYVNKFDEVIEKSLK